MTNLGRVDLPKIIELAHLLVGCANLLDTIKAEWGESWSEWDQSMRDGITYHLKIIYAAMDAIPQATPEPARDYDFHGNPPNRPACPELDKDDAE